MGCILLIHINKGLGFELGLGLHVSSARSCSKGSNHESCPSKVTLDFCLVTNFPGHSVT